MEPGESKQVTITIDPAATNHPFGVWDYGTQRFVTKPGEYTVYVGNSTDNSPYTATFTVAEGTGPVKLAMVSGGVTDDQTG